MCNSVLRKIEQKCHNKLNTVIINSTDVGNKKKNEEERTQLVMHQRFPQQQHLHILCSVMMMMTSMSIKGQTIQE